MSEKNNKNDIIALRRGQLTRAAYEVVSQKGFYDFTVRDIARKAGLSTGLVHYYFKSKQDLLLNLIRQMNENLVVYFTKALDRCCDDPMDKLRVFVPQAFDIVNNQKDYFSVVIDFWSQINRNERIRKANIKLFMSYRHECSKILEEGVEKGVFVPMDIHFTTSFILSLIVGLIIQYVIDRDAFSYEDYTARVLDRINALVLKKE